MLGGGCLDPENAAAAAELLARLGLDGSTGQGALAALLAAAARMSRIFEVRSPHAPGLACIGGTADPLSYGSRLAGYPRADVSGRGATMAQAFGSCVGEAIEYLSHLTWGDERLIE